MAFETTNVYSTDHSLLLAYLQEHAVPDYFDAVEADAETATTINCYVGDVVLMRIYISSGNYKDSAVQITTTNGSTKNASESTITTRYFQYATKCAGGISLAIGSSNETTNAPAVVITKDSAGNTAIVSATSLYGASSGLGAVTATDTTILSQSLTNRLTAAVTTVVPFICGCGAGECRYTPNVVYFPTAQYTDPGEIIVNGSRYLSNGYWALKDE